MYRHSSCSSASHSSKMAHQQPRQSSGWAQTSTGQLVWLPLRDSTTEVGIATLPSLMVVYDHFKFCRRTAHSHFFIIEITHTKQEYPQP